jgi:K+-transporting ATPase ATPase A chain
MQLAVYFAALVVSAPLLGRYLAAVFTGTSPHWMWPIKVIEDRMYRLAGCTPEREMRWTEYAAALLWFNLLGLVALLGLQLAQSALPLNPEKLPSVSWPLAINTSTCSPWSSRAATGTRR